MCSRMNAVCCKREDNSFFEWRMLVVLYKGGWQFSVQSTERLTYKARLLSTLKLGSYANMQDRDC